MGDERGQAASCYVEEGRQDTDERQLLGVLGATRTYGCVAMLCCSDVAATMSMDVIEWLGDVSS